MPTFLYSLRYRIVATVVVIEVVMLSILVWSNTQEIKRTHNERLRDSSSIILQQFVKTTGRYLIEVDYPSLVEYANGILQHQELSYIVVRDISGDIILDLGDMAIARQPFGNPEFIADGNYVRQTDVEFAGRRRGDVQMGFSLALMERAAAQSRNRGIAIAATEIGLSILAALAIGFALTRNLSTLANAAERFGGGDTDVAVPISSRDEVGRVAAAFNSMVADRKRADAAIRASEHRFRAVAETTPVPLAIARHSDGKVLFANPRLGPLLGLSAEEVEGRNFRSFLLDPTEHDRLVDQLAQQGQVLNREIMLQRKDGEKLSVLLSSRTMNFDDMPAIVFGFIDITDRKKTEAQLAQAQKMEAIGQLTGGVAHDFNNLLSVILGNLDTLHEQTKDKKQLQAAIDPAIRSALRGSELTQRLLAFSRKQLLQPTIVDVNQLVFGMSDLLRRTLGETIEIKTALADGLWPTTIDPGQLENAVLNLAINARDAMPGGGTLTIETANTTLDRAIVEQHDDIAPGDYVMVRVSDTGSGMPTDVVARVFEPFFTTKRAGSGLGLSMVYGFVKQSGGHIQLRSELEKGTDFELYFRRAGKKPIAPEESEQPRPVGEKARGEVVLVVEDDEDLYDLAVNILRSLGYRVLGAKDARSALAVADDAQELDLLFTDIVLPGGMNGLELAKQASTNKPNLKVLFTSGYADSTVLKGGHWDLATHLIKKPFRRQDLARKIRQVLDQETA